MGRALWGSWRACLGWGLATLVVAVILGFAIPDTLAYPLANSRITSPILAFEFARDETDLVSVFGKVGDSSHDDRIAGFRTGNLLDYLFMLTYGSFLFSFFRSTAADLGAPRWRVVGWLAPVAAVSDGIENAILLSLNAELADPLGRLAILAWPVWVKFGLLSVLSGAAGLALWRQRAWPLALPCLAVPMLALPAIALPHRWGQVNATAIGISWLALLLWTAWRTFVPAPGRTARD